MRSAVTGFLTVFFLSGLTSVGNARSAVDSVAEAYVKYVLAVGQYEPDFVDAYFGPEEWREEARSNIAKELPYSRLAEEGTSLLQALSSLRTEGLTHSETIRAKFLSSHIKAALTVVEKLRGTSMTFDEESHGLYDAVLPERDSLYFQRALNQLNDLLPGEGSVSERYITFSRQFNVPRERLDTLFRICINECRQRTKAHLRLPDDEHFVVEYVSGQPWGAYNWYKGGGRSLIQINTDRDFDIGSILGTAAHEGYPGHHVLAVIQEERLYRDSGWVEFAVQPLYCPSSLVSEGLANLGVDVLFTPAEKRAFYREVLFPLAGLDTALVDQYLQVKAAARGLEPAWTEAARIFLDGSKSGDETVSFLMHYAGRSESGAKGAITFYKKYRSYVINYTLGEELARAYVFAGQPSREEIWNRYLNLILTPVTASDLIDRSSPQ